MNTVPRTARLPVAAFVSGVLAVLCGVLTLLTRGDLFLLGATLFLILAVALGCWAWLTSIRSSPKPNANSLLGWGLGLAGAAMLVGILIPPHL
jgi:hypothetical protein